MLTKIQNTKWHISAIRRLNKQLESCQTAEQFRTFQTMLCNYQLVFNPNKDKIPIIGLLIALHKKAVKIGEDIHRKNKGYLHPVSHIFYEAPVDVVVKNIVCDLEKELEKLLAKEQKQQHLYAYRNNFINIIELTRYAIRYML